MATQIKTYMVNGLNTSINLYSSDLSDYQGCLFYIQGGGSIVGNFSPDLFYGGQGGYVNSGYIDFYSPYAVDFISMSCDNITLLGNTIIEITYINDNTAGALPVKIQAYNGTLIINNSSDGDNQPPSIYYKTGYYVGELSINNLVATAVVDQRGNEYSSPGSIGGYTTISSGNNVTSDYGNNVSGLYGGAGLYGSNGNIGGYGYGSGKYDPPGTYGYGVISLIPKSAIVNSNFITSNTTIGSTGITGPNGFALYNIVGGGGGGASQWGFDTSCGGGGAGDIISGILNIPTSQNLNITIGSGGYGGYLSTVGIANGGDGGNTTIGYGSSNIVSAGGFGGFTDGTNGLGCGGPGYYGGGGGLTNSTVDGKGGSSFTNAIGYEGKNANNTPNYAGKGGGSVSDNIKPFYYGYGGGPVSTSSNHNGGGGGGGYYGGNGSLDGVLLGPLFFADATGFGCGGGGGSFYGTNYSLGGDGSAGYALINYISSDNIKTYKITGNRNFSFMDWKNSSGFWFFLSGDGTAYNGQSYKNTGHFLIVEDGVQGISFTQNGGYYTINVYFNTLNGKQQTFTLTATSPQSYAMILFYV
jgi:hypothetical protein